MLRLFCLSPRLAFGQTATKNWTPPKTSWGDPDLEGTWTSDDQYGVPFERPAKFGTRKTLTEQELAERVKEDELSADQRSIAGERPNVRLLEKPKGKGVDAAAAPANWFRNSHAGHRGRPHLVVDPPDGRIPLTETGKALAAAAAARRGPTARFVARPDHVRSLYYARAWPGRFCRWSMETARSSSKPKDMVAHTLRDDPRDAHCAHGRAAASARGSAKLHGRSHRPLGRQHAGSGNHELHRRTRWGGLETETGRRTATS